MKDKTVKATVHKRIGKCAENEIHYEVYFYKP